MAKVLLVLYPDPVTGYPPVSARDSIPVLHGYPGGQTLPSPSAIDFAPGVPAFRIDSVDRIPLDPTFPRSIFHMPWMAFVSAERSAGLRVVRDIATECTDNDGLLMTATMARLDPTNREHVRRARILAETLIACVGN